MVLWVGVDDTDSLRGMCTTFLATELVRELTRTNDLIGYPRLVRLNPNIPWKTRGNGAICIRFGRGRGEPKTIGEIEGHPIRSFPSGETQGSPSSMLAAAAKVVEKWAEFEDPTTNPGLVVLERRPSPALYWRAVREILDIQEVLETVRKCGLWKGYKNQRGIIGAAAATAWRPRDKTYELLAYRERSAWGRPRFLDPASVLSMDARFPSTFNNVDAPTRHVAIAPHSPCPVLYGIRGDDPADLPSAMQALVGESPSRWLLVETNQGTDDHIVPDDWSLRPYTSTSLDVKVLADAHTDLGGHVFVRCGGDREIDLAFYEPSKTFRRIARSLAPGDRLRVWGSVREDRRSLNVEKLRLDALVPCWMRVANPVCPECAKSMKSIGRDKGFRCIHGHGHAPAGAGTWWEVPRLPQLGWYEPPVFARRHLAKPVKRMGLSEPNSQILSVLARPISASGWARPAFRGQEFVSSSRRRR
jgi:tRNA(Ile2)-agmatinylcytidine synthase